MACALNGRQLQSVLRDLCRTINFVSAEKEIARIESGGLYCEGWQYLPPWVRLLRLKPSTNAIVLSLQLQVKQPAVVVAGLLASLRELLIDYVGYQHMPLSYPKRIFGIGWQKTGTTSLTEAMRILGIFSWHFAPWAIGADNYRTYPPRSHLDTTSIIDYSFVSDSPICMGYRQLDEEFPGSLFVMTTRTPDLWLESALRHFDNQLAEDACIHGIDQWAYGISGGIDRETLLNQFIRHETEVRDYFSGRSDFLEIDVAHGNTWGKLCQFLGISARDRKFPHRNRHV